MNGLLEYRLSLEDDGIKRLIWILQVKQTSLLNSVTKMRFNLKRDEQIIILRKKGLKHQELCSTAKHYGVGLEMFT